MLPEALHLLISVSLGGTVEVHTHRGLCNVADLYDTRNVITCVGRQTEVVGPVTQVAITIPTGVQRVIEVHRVENLNGEVVLGLVVQMFYKTVVLTCWDNSITNDKTCSVGSVPRGLATGDVWLQSPLNMVTCSTVNAVPVQMYTISVDDSGVIRVGVSLACSLVRTEHCPEELTIIGPIIIVIRTSCKRNTNCKQADHI